MTNYPTNVNGWISNMDFDNMSYSKVFNNYHSEAVALCWMYVDEGEEGYNPEGDCYTLIWAENTEYESALDSLYYSNATFGGIMRREEAVKELYKYMETH